MQKRNYGIDLLRIAATLMIIVLHILGAGGVLRSIEPDSMNYKVFWLVEIAAYCAVNCYALISGYVGIHSKFRFSNIVKLWMQVAFYTVTLYLVGSFWIEGITWKTIVKACFPVMIKEYWYFTAYFCMYFMMPFLNMILEAMDLKKAKGFIVVSMVLFTIMPIIARKDLFSTNNGYSVAWLVILYLFGGVIRKYEAEIRIRKWLLLSGYVVSVLVTFVVQVVEIPFFERGFLMIYNSPTMVAAAVCLVLLFKEINAAKMVGVIKVLAPVTFGVYLIHVHTAILDYVLPGKFFWVVQPNLVLSLVLLGVSALVIFAGCAVIELARIKLFELCRIGVFAKWLEKKINIYC